jgi:hypothetical protein
MRGLAFTHEVKTAMLSKEGVRAFIQALLREQYPPEKLAAEEEMMRYFGLLRSDQRLESIYLSMMEAQVAGLYDPPRKTLFIVPGPLAGSMTLVHEMAHALADQHFDLDALERSARTDDDRALALAALVEGEATLAMSRWAAAAATGPGRTKLPGDDPEMLKAAASNGLEEVPDFLRDGLLFPYLSGSAWATVMAREGGGMTALDAWFRDPPESTEQILHPDRSIPVRDVPSRLDDASLGALEPLVKKDTMGEFGIRFLLGETAAEGWDADRYLLGGAAGARSLSWLSAWDTEDDAREFESAALERLPDRTGQRCLSARRERAVMISCGETSAPATPTGVTYR